MTPLMCTQTGLFHVDYGIPLLATKSTDYRTSSAKNHGFVPSVPQYFDCRVKARVKPELLDKDIALRNEFKSVYTKEFEEKHAEPKAIGDDQAMNLKRLDFMRTAQEKIFTKPPPPKPPKISEMRDSYPIHYSMPVRDQNVNIKCQMPETFRAMQPDINPAAKGFYKLLDIYLTENRLKYAPYTPEQLAKAQEDLITIYNAHGKHKGLKEELPGKLDGYTNIYDKRVFRVEYPNRLLSNAPKRVPHSGAISEYQSNYPNPACSDFYPYRQENGVYFPETLSKSGPWQDLCPPAMYCSENCHIGTGWPIRAVVDVNAPAAEHMNAHTHAYCCANKDV